MQLTAHSFQLSGFRPGPARRLSPVRGAGMTLLGGGAGLVELEQPFQDLLVGEVGGPAVGGGDGGVEVAVGVVVPEFASANIRDQRGARCRGW
jgi:hypothetical protein